MIWNIKVWQTCKKKKKNQEGGQHFFTPLYIYIYIYIFDLYLAVFLRSTISV